MNSIGNEISSIVSSGTGLGHTVTRRSIDTGEERSENKELRVIKKLDDERKKVPVVYNSKGKIIEEEYSKGYLFNAEA